MTLGGSAMEFDGAEGLALRRWPGGGLLESSLAGHCRA